MQTDTAIGEILWFATGRRQDWSMMANILNAKCWVTRVFQRQSGILD